jgi:hypothetical protein
MSGSESIRCADCPEHSGVIAELNSGQSVMARLEKSIEELRKDFNHHVASSAKSTIALLLGILMCFLTGVVGIYVNTITSKGSDHVEIAMLVKEINKAMKKAKE